MEMWLKQATLLVLTVAAAAMAISSNTPVFLNNEDQIFEVSVGSTLTLYCCLDTYDRSWIFWHFIPSENRSNSREIWKKMINKSSSTSVVECQHSGKTYSLSDLNETDSGWYYCEVSVDIPKQMKNQSNVTKVVITKSIVERTTSFVTSKPESSSASTLQFEWWMWILAGVSSFILVILTVGCILLRRCTSRNGAEDPIYANTHCNSKQPSPRPTVNQLKSNPSSQNLREPSPGQRYGEGKRRPKH